MDFNLNIECVFRLDITDNYIMSYYSLLRGARMGEVGRPPETEKIVVEKQCHFPKLYKMTMVMEDRIENGYKNQFSIEIFIFKI